MIVKNPGLSNTPQNTPIIKIVQLLSLMKPDFLLHLFSVKVLHWES